MGREGGVGVASAECEECERSGQTMASPENLGSLYLSAAALAFETVGLEMITGLALSKARLRRVSSRPAWGLLVRGSIPRWRTCDSYRPRQLRDAAGPC